MDQKHKYSTMINWISWPDHRFYHFLPIVFKDKTCHVTPIPTISSTIGINKLDQKITAEMVRVIHNVAMVLSFACFVMPFFSV